MAYNYSNPFQQSPGASRSTFTAASGSVSGYQVIFSGLPLDVSEKDLRDLLINEPLGLAASTTIVRSFFGQDGRSLGTALIQVGTEADAERIRREYSGQTIDGTFKLLVQHLLPPTQPLPAPSVTPLAFPSTNVPARQPVQPRAAVQPRAPAAQMNARPPTGPRAPVKGPQGPKGASNKPPGLELLSRLSKTGAAPTAKDKQMALLAKQKANLKASGGGSLLGRLAKPKQNPVAAKAKAQAKVAAGGAAKVARAKKANNGNAMDVDRDVAGGGAKKQEKQEKPKAKKPTQEDLDEEMRAYERQRRFGA